MNGSYSYMCTSLYTYYHRVIHYLINFVNCTGVHVLRKKKSVDLGSSEESDMDDENRLIFQWSEYLYFV